MTDINWRELNLNRDEDQAELEKLIAERLGWTKLNFIPELYGISPNGVGKARVPSFCTEIDAAIQLKHEGYRLILEQIDGTWRATFDKDVPATSVGGRHDNPAIAICLAWLHLSKP